MIPRFSRSSCAIVSLRSYHYSTPKLSPRNTEHVKRPVLKTVRVLHLKTLQRVIGFGLHCNVGDRSARKQLYFCRVKVNNYPLTPVGRDNHTIEVGDFFTMDSPVFDMMNGIFYYTKCAEIVKIEKRDKSKEPPRVLKPGIRQLILRQREKWKFVVTLSITVTTKSFYRRIMYSDIPKKGQTAFNFMLSLCPAKTRSERSADWKEAELVDNPDNIESDSNIV